jgi:glycosyltransferase involved in cell wall biosynthesis
MNILFFTHPTFLSHKSMPRYAEMLYNGMKARGHEVKMLMPLPFFINLPAPKAVKKWLGYIDQYVAFPVQIRKLVKKASSDTLFVFTDHALGPWVPLVVNRKHIIHCHDFMAQRSAMNLIPENPISWTGKKYQAYIKQGYCKGRNFISVSKKTQTELHELLPKLPVSSVVVYNGLNYPFKNIAPIEARERLSRKTGLPLQDGFILHVGGNQWYKNRKGVVSIYSEWRGISDKSYPLLLVGEEPDNNLITFCQSTSYNNEIYFVATLNNAEVNDAYSGALVFLFPSLDEGFGWPIAEAMAAGCPVITTDKAPMTEVGGDAAILISRMPIAKQEIEIEWAGEGAAAIEEIVMLTEGERAELIRQGVANAERFNPELALECIEKVYEAVSQTS